MKKERMQSLILLYILSFFLLVLGFFAVIIIRADWVDYQRGKLEDFQVLKDVIFVGWWFALFSLVRYIYRQNRK